MTELVTELVTELRTIELLVGLDDEVLERIAGLIILETLGSGETLIVEGVLATDLYFVRSGSFVATVLDGNSETEVNRLGPGDVIGESQLIAGGRRTATVRALEKSVVLHLPAAEFDALAADNELLRLALSSVIHQRLRNSALRDALRLAVGSDLELIDLLSYRASWVQLRRGEVLWEQGADADDWCVLVSGELSVVTDKHGERRQISSVRRGEVFGEVALLQSEPRSATILAVRESWLARFDANLLNEEILTRNNALQTLLHTITSRLSAQSRTAAESTRVLAVMPRTPSVDTDELLRSLNEAMGGHSLVVDVQMLRTEGVIGDPEQIPVGHPAWLRFEAWVESQLRHLDYLLLVTNGGDNAWTHTAVNLADRVLLVADADDDPQQKEIEAKVLDRTVLSRVPPVWLVLVHPPERLIPTGTANWLDARVVDHHAHIRRGHARDIARLARWLSGETLGLALSGGGARGFVHLGAAEAMFDAGYELDLIVGTSAGAMSAALLARDEAPAVLLERGRDAIAKQGNPFTQFDLPLISLLRSRRLRDGLKEVFGEMTIEDSWIPMRVVATDLTASRSIVFNRGPVWHRVYASSSPPGIMAPVQYEDRLLCDGGLVDNLPVSVLVEAGCQLKVACYVGSTSSLLAPKNGMPTSWALLIDRILGRRRHQDVPTLLATLMQCVSVPSATQLELARAASDIFFQPDLSAYPAIDFSAAQEMFETGQSHARAVLEALLEKN